MVKILKNLLFQNQWTDDLEIWYVALCTPILPRLFKLCPWVDLDLFYTKFKFGHIGFCMGKIENYVLLAHLAQKAIVSYCHTSACVVHRQPILENKFSNVFSYKTTGPTVLKFHMEHDLTARSQNYKIGSGGISKMATVTKHSKNNKINFSRTTGYFWLNFGMEYQ